MAAPHKLRVDDPGLAKAIVAHGGAMIADYGGFQIIEADDAVLTNLDPRFVERQDDYDVIKLNAGSLNTRAAEVRALRKPAADFSGRHLHLVQFAGPVKPEWRAALERTGARIISLHSRKRLFDLRRCHGVGPDAIVGGHKPVRPMGRRLR